MTPYDTIDGVMAELYDVISGPAGPRDWQRNHRLYYPDARLIRISPGPDGRPRAEVMTPKEHAASADEYLRTTDFYEMETERRVERFGHIAQVMSAYECRPSPDSKTLIKRGVNFVHLYHDGERWWITAAIWDNEVV